MRVRLALAIILSIVLIGIASWTRLSNTNQNLQIGLESQPIISNDYAETFKRYLANSTSTTNSTNTALTNTDFIGRQLVIDYVSLATNNQATPENLDALAQKYVETIPALEQATVITPSDLHLVPTTKTSLTNYANTLVKIETEYRSAVANTYTNTPNSITLGPGLYSVTEKVGEIYRDTAKRLRDMNTPSALITQQVRLVNYYFSNAQSMKSIAEAENDPALAFSGLVRMNDSLEEESAILSSINTILNANGI